jgi:uncharacterized protein
MNIPPSDLPLFPLRTVLFPQMPLPLRVFEPRYHELVGRCLKEDIGFGVLLIKSGEEVGGPAEPFNSGTVARIVQVDKQGDGTLNILSVGVVRFRLLATRSDKSYLTGTIERWPDDLGEPRKVDALVPQARKAYSAYATELVELMGAQLPGGRLEVPSDPQVLSYLVASNLQIAAEDKLALLEAVSVQERLEQELELLARERQMLVKAKSLRASMPPDIDGFSKN